MEFRLGELFCGPGGLALGAMLAESCADIDGETFSITPVWGVDKDPNAIETYKRNIANGHEDKAIRKDANTFCNKHILEYEDIEALAFGFPCNDYSMVGEQKGIRGKFGNLYRAGITAINKRNPEWFIAENVSGIHGHDSGKTFLKILKELRFAGQGYKLTAHLYKFEEYGVPQYRHRYIIIGVREGLKKRDGTQLEFKVPAPTHGPERIPFVTAEHALAGLNTSDLARGKRTQNSERVIMRLKFTPPWHNAWYLDELAKMRYADRRQILQGLLWYETEFAHLTDEQIAQKLAFARLRCKKARMSHIYKRLSADRPAYTITGSGGGGTHVYHWCEHRALTNIERAALQGFPSNFVFEGGKNESIRKQIGMAVPPIGAKIIFEAILKTFAEIEYENVQESVVLPVDDNWNGYKLSIVS